MKVQRTAATAGAVDDGSSIALPGGFNIFLLIVILLPAALLVAIGKFVSTAFLPVPLKVLLVLVAICAFLLLLSAVSQLFGSTLSVGADDITHSKLLYSKTYKWTDVDDIRLVSPTNTLSDSPFADTSKRLGLGLFIRDSKGHRDNDDYPDVVLCSGGESKAEFLISVAEKLKVARTRAAMPRRGGAARGGRLGGKIGQFSRRGDAAGAR